MDGSSILITGGTGSLGQALVRTLLSRFDLRRIVIFSRDELKQSEMAHSDFAVRDEGKRLRFFIGDIRDRDRLHRAMEGVDSVIHAAALKQVPASEYNPMEFIKTNILGAQNVIEAALDADVRRVVSLSTDKAAAPINLYGATKLASDKLFTAANNIKGHRDIRFSVVRYGNVMGSRGSVVPLFLQRAHTGVLPITDSAMTRFNISLQDGVELVLWALQKAQGGEVFVPKIPSYRIMDMAEAIAPSAEYRIVGVRSGEKIHEEMITSSDSHSTVDVGPYFAILPTKGMGTVREYVTGTPAVPVESGFRYASDSNDAFLAVDDLRKLIREQIDPNFEPK